MASRVMSLRRAGACVQCRTPLPVGARAYWDAVAKTVTCLICHEGPGEVERGTAGASAAREHARRRAKREERVRTAHPHIGGLVLSLRDAPQHEKAWRRGADGERSVGAALEQRTTAIVMHDRRMPGGRGNIDHIAIAPSGVYVVDAKDLDGRVAVSRSLFGRERLLVDGRNRTELVEGVERQVAAVSSALLPEVRVHGVLCFTRADLPMFGTPRMRSVLVLYRRALAKRLNGSGDLGPSEIDSIERTLAVAFPPA